MRLGRNNLNMFRDAKRAIQRAQNFAYDRTNYSWRRSHVWEASNSTWPLCREPSSRFPVCGNTSQWLVANNIATAVKVRRPILTSLKLVCNTLQSIWSHRGANQFEFYDLHGNINNSNAHSSSYFARTIHGNWWSNSWQIDGRIEPNRAWTLCKAWTDRCISIFKSSERIVFLCCMRWTRLWCELSSDPG